MIVSELIEQLSRVDGNRLVVLAMDGEGNGYSPMDSFFVGAYAAETPCSGDVGFESIEDLEDGYTEEDVIEDGVPAVIFTPSN